MRGALGESALPGNGPLGETGPTEGPPAMNIMSQRRSESALVHIGGQQVASATRFPEGKIIASEYFSNFSARFRAVLRTYSYMSADAASRKITDTDGSPSR